MAEADVGSLVVMNEGALEGIITDRDLVVRCLSGGHDSSTCWVSEHMSAPVETVEPTADMLDAARRMTERQIRRLPVVDDAEVVGVVSLSDVALAFDVALEHMDRSLHDLLRGMGASRSA
jgi:CBS domain-containing protein